MILPLRYSTIPMALALWLACGVLAFGAGSPKACDSLIKAGIDAMWKKEHVTSLELLTAARTTAEKNGWYPQLFSALNNTGGNYYLMLDYGEALHYYLEAYTIALRHLDASKEMIILNNIGILYRRQGNFKKAEEYFSQAYSLAKEVHDARKTGFYAVNLGSLYNEIRMPGKALGYLREATALLKADTTQLLLARIALARNELIRGQTSQARKKASILLADENLIGRDNQIVLYLLMGQSFYADRNYPQAVSWLERAVALQPDLEKQATIFKLLSDTFFEAGDYKNAISLRDSVSTAKERLEEQRNDALFASNAVKLKLAHYSTALKLEKEKRNRQHLLFTAGIIVLLCLLAALLLVLKNISNRHRYRKQQADKDRAISELLQQQLTDEKLLLQEREKTALLERQYLEQEIALQNQKMASKALYISERDQLLKQILQSLSKIPELEGRKTILSQIRTLKRHISLDKDWDNFVKHFEQVNQGFLRRLVERHPNLNSNDIRLLSYAFMNLTPKETATVLNISPEAFRKRKERIMEKLALSDDVSLTAYLTAL
jgi:tetratricopeptide (TPR) repeat protein